MELPEVDIQPQDTPDLAASKVEEAFGASGSQLSAVEGLNSVLPASAPFRFLHGSLEGREFVFIVATAPWDDAATLSLLNVLLGVRLDPDPPGSTPYFRFYSAHPVPPVLLGLFGDSAACDFECRAALAAQFGQELEPSKALQLAAVGMFLLRESLGVKSGFSDPDGDVNIGTAIVERFSDRDFPGEASPLNAIITLGFLYGEVLRSRLPFEARWTRLKDSPSWPVLIWGPRRVQARTGRSEGGDRGIPQVVFSPISSVATAWEEGKPTLLREVTSSLLEKCGEVLR